MYAQHTFPSQIKISMLRLLFFNPIFSLWDNVYVSTADGQYVW